jgi:hypothetical protein
MRPIRGWLCLASRVSQRPSRNTSYQALSAIFIYRLLLGFFIKDDPLAGFVFHVVLLSCRLEPGIRLDGGGSKSDLKDFVALLVRHRDVVAFADHFGFFRANPMRDETCVVLRLFVVSHTHDRAGHEREVGLLGGRNISACGPTAMRLACSDEANYCSPRSRAPDHRPSQSQETRHPVCLLSSSGSRVGRHLKASPKLAGQNRRLVG